MTKESAVAKYSTFGQIRPGTPSNLIHIDFARKAGLPENITRFPESSPNLTIIRPDQRLAQIIELQNPRIDISANLVKPEIGLLEKTKKAETFNPSKKSKSYIDQLRRHFMMRRSRRGSRCLAQPDHEPRDCQGRRHLKKSKSMQNEQIPTGTIKIEKTSGSKQPFASTQREVVLNGKKIK